MADPKNTGSDRDSGRQPTAGRGAASTDPKKGEPQRGQGQQKGSSGAPQEDPKQRGGAQHEGTSDRGSGASGTQRPQSGSDEPEDREEEQEIDIPAGDPAKRSPVYTDPPRSDVHSRE